MLIHKGYSEHRNPSVTTRVGQRSLGMMCFSLCQKHHSAINKHIRYPPTHPRSWATRRAYGAANINTSIVHLEGHRVQTHTWDVASIFPKKWVHAKKRFSYVHLGPANSSLQYNENSILFEGEGPQDRNPTCRLSNVHLSGTSQFATYKIYSYFLIQGNLPSKRMPFALHQHYSDTRTWGNRLRRP